jgi:hypothetical protein
MGLDVSAYSNVRLIKQYDSREQFYEDRTIPSDVVFVSSTYVDNPSFPDQLGDSNLVSCGLYVYNNAYGFRAGSYSGYNNWRDRLSRTVMGVPAEEVWHNPDKYRDKPFYHIINFSDCEGIIAGNVAVESFEDFRSTYREVVLDVGNHGFERVCGSNLR